MFFHRSKNWLLGINLILRRWIGPASRARKADLLRGLRVEREELDALVHSLDEGRRLTPLLSGGWSVKDLMAHLAIWDERGLGWIRAAAAGRLPDMPLPGYTWSDFDRLNRRTYLDHRDRPLAEVETWFYQSYADLVAGIEDLPERQAENPLAAELVRWRAKHYRSHREELESALVGGLSVPCGNESGYN